MKEFAKDYAKLCKETGSFYKKHWLGVAVMNTVVVAAEVAWLFKEPIKDHLKSKKNKGEES